MKKNLKKSKKKLSVSKKENIKKQKKFLAEPETSENSSKEISQNLIAIYVSPSAREVELFFKELLSLNAGKIMVVDDSENLKYKKLYRNLGINNVIYHKKSEGFEKSFAEIADFAKKSGCVYLVVLEARTPVWLEYLNHFLEEIHHYEVISGSQYLDPQLLTDMPNLADATLNKILCHLIARYTGIHLTDVFAPYLAFKIKSLEKINYKQIKFFPIHFWFELAKHKPRFCEIPIPLSEPSKIKAKSKQIPPEHKLENYLKIIEEVIKKK